MSKSDCRKEARPRRPRASISTLMRPVLLVVGTLLVAACARQNNALYHPTPEDLATQAPDSFIVDVETSEGVIALKMRRHWSPLGVDRVWHLMSNDFYAGARIYRMVDGFVAQWGFSGDPVRDSVWRDLPLDDEPVVASNRTGTVSFARGGPRTRSMQLFINLVDNERLDAMMAGGVEGYPPLGEIEAGGQVPAGFYGAYADRTPSQDSIRILGNDYLRREYPQLDSIIATRIRTFWR